MSNSNLEIEAKFYVTDLDQIRMRLRPPPPFGHLPQIRNKIFQKFLSAYSRILGRLGGGLIQPRTLETNIRFDLPDASLRSEGRVLRLRRDTEARLTYKGSARDERGASSRTEIEFIVEDFEKARQFLEALGYQQLLTYDKYREIHQLGDCHIMLDELPYGNFVEIEGENAESIQAVAAQLKLNWDTAIPRSYSALFEAAKKALNLSFQNLSFENFAGIKVMPSHLGVRTADHDE